MTDRAGWYIDTALLTPRRVMTQQSDSEHEGYKLELECGHSIWSAIMPHAEAAFCGQCLQQLVQQIREMQERQREP